MSSTTLAKNRKTPGVYVTEFPAFPPSIVGVATAVPVFIGYTETAADPGTGKQMYYEAIALSSMVEFISYFGQAYDTLGSVINETGDNYDFQANSLQLAADGSVGTVATKYSVATVLGAEEVQVLPKFNLYGAMQLFFSNGGGNCYVISVGNYAGTQNQRKMTDEAATQIMAEDLLAGLAIAEAVKGATMLVVPDACLLENDKCANVAVAMLKQAAKLQDRVAILDLPGALDSAKWTPKAMSDQTQLYCASISAAQEAFSYGALYGPALESSLLSIDNVLYTSLWASKESRARLNNLLTTQAMTLYPTPADATDYNPVFVAVAERIAIAFPVADYTTASYGLPPSGTLGSLLINPTDTVQVVVSLPQGTVKQPTSGAESRSLDQYLTNAVPLLGQIEQILARQLNVVPPSGIMAGVWAQNDANRGVWNAPANLSLNQIIAPKVLLNDEQQGEFNVPLNGNSVCILRASASRGTVVWGARTLDGNSLDYRYIQVRRTLNYIEQSIKQALQQFVFAANNGGTWATVTAAVSSFLTQFWQAGGLMGDKASDAFTVNCGVPTTMSGLDVLNGYMIVSVQVQLIHPAEFIELTFKQTMQGV